MWARLNNISFHNVKIAHTTGKGYGVVCATDLEPTDDASPAAPLLTVPHALVLNAASVDEYAKEDINFRQLLEAVGHRVIQTPNPLPDSRTPPPHTCIWEINS